MPHYLSMQVISEQWFKKKTQGLGGGLRLKLGLSLDVRCGVRLNEATE